MGIRSPQITNMTSQEGDILVFPLHFFDGLRGRIQVTGAGAWTFIILFALKKSSAIGNNVVRKAINKWVSPTSLRMNGRGCRQINECFHEWQQHSHPTSSELQVQKHKEAYIKDVRPKSPVCPGLSEGLNPPDVRVYSIYDEMLLNGRHIQIRVLSCA